MATLRIPTPGPADFGFLYRIQIEEVFYRFQFRWNVRDNSWYLDIGDDAGNAIARSMRMVLGEEILRPHKALAIPQGNLRVVDTTGKGIEATRTEFGQRVLLEYVEVS